MRLLEVDGHWRTDLRTPRGRRQLEASLSARTPAGWVRAGLFYGDAPGSHMAGKHFTAWRTRCGPLRGLNVRAGWWPEPCMTVLLHACRETPADRAGGLP
jgi:hypothetical protein